MKPQAEDLIRHSSSSCYQFEWKASMKCQTQIRVANAIPIFFSKSIESDDQGTKIRIRSITRKEIKPTRTQENVGSSFDLIGWGTS